MADRYSPELMKHFTNPQNIGKLEDSTLAATGFNESDGDGVTFYLKIIGDSLSDVKYTIKGCPRAIASSSFTSEMIKGKTIEEILNIDEKAIFKALDIDESFKCISMPLKAVQNALKAYLS
ncbi:MAG TPA: iron-sulfur cluster assembly scaffold protein [Thermotogota bacterium]|nr:iron-sulfur cluster assembly scaffold protein [Thermotogota bacterium]HPJ87633.1 iron-sulfur cluster assembly scaffold protein [Thermotogota bacterium]HPR94929.1 iron-sulfur cluster assembly scaffold protein [Thermotogota bacterium]